MDIDTFTDAITSGTVEEIKNTRQNPGLISRFYGR